MLSIISLEGFYELLPIPTLCSAGDYPIVRLCGCVEEEEEQGRFYLFEGVKYLASMVFAF